MQKSMTTNFSLTNSKEDIPDRNLTLTGFGTFLGGGNEVSNSEQVLVGPLTPQWHVFVLMC